MAWNLNPDMRAMKHTAWVRRRAAVAAVALVLLLRLKDTGVRGSGLRMSLAFGSGVEVSGFPGALRLRSLENLCAQDFAFATTKGAAPLSLDRESP